MLDSVLHCRVDGMAQTLQGVRFRPVQLTLAGRNDLRGNSVECFRLVMLFASGSEKRKVPIGAEIRLPLLSSVLRGVQCARLMTA